MLHPEGSGPENLRAVGGAGKVPLPGIPADSLLLCVYPPTGVRAPAGSGQALYFMVKYRMYGSGVVSLPLIALIAVGIALSTNDFLGKPSVYGGWFKWVIGLCAVMYVAHVWSFLRALRRVRRVPERPEVLARALGRGPVLVWFFALVVLAQYGFGRDKGALVMSGILAGLALLTHLVVWASRRGRVTEDRVG